MTGLALRLAVRNLRRHRWRTTLVGLGVSLGAAAVVLHGSMVAGIRAQMLDHLVVSQYGHVTVSPAAPPRPPSDEEATAPPWILKPAPLMEAIRLALPGVRIAPSLSSLGMAFGEEASTARIALWGIDPRQEAILTKVLPRRSNDRSTVLEPGSILLGASLARRLEVEPGDPVTLSVLDPEGDFDAIDYRVAGILKPGAPWQDYFVYLVLEDLQELMGVEDAVSMLKLRLPGGLARADAAALRVRSALQSHAVKVATYEETGSLYLGILAASRIQAWMIDIVLLVAVAFGVAGAQILAVHERQREFGTMAALGTSRSVIRGMILSEGLLLSLLAGSAGALLGVVVSLALARTGFGMDAEAFAWMVGGPRVLPQVDVMSIAWTLLELAVVVTLAGLYPAARAARLLPVDAWRGGTS